VSEDKPQPARFAAAGLFVRSDGQIGQFDNLAGIGSHPPIDDAGARQNSALTASAAASP
jgi:hypothetical protein